MNMFHLNAPNCFGPNGLGRSWFISPIQPDIIEFHMFTFAVYLILFYPEMSMNQQLDSINSHAIVVGTLACKQYDG